MNKVTQKQQKRFTSHVLLQMLFILSFAIPTFALVPSSFSLGRSTVNIETSSHSLTEERLITAIPFTRDTSSLIVVSVQINGHDAMPFMVDTGSSQPILIEKWAANQLKLVPSKENVTFLPGNRTFPVTMLQNIVIKANAASSDIDFGSLPACIGDFEVPGSGASRIAGVLGLPLFSKFIMQLDFSQQSINLLERLDRSQLEPNALCLPLTQPDPATVRFSVAWPPCSLRVKNSQGNETQKKQDHIQAKTVKGSFLIDTGSDSSSLPETFVSDLHPIAMSVGTRFSIAGTSQDSFALIPNLCIGDIVISNLCVASSTSQRNALPVRVIGLDILEHFRMTLDFPGKQMFLDKFDNKASSTAAATTGIQLEKQKEEFFVAGILSRSPAKKAAIQVGNKVTRIDGLDLANCSIETAQQMLDGNAGTEAKLLIASIGSEPRQVSLPRVTFYDASLYPNYGFLFAKRLADQAILVGYILCSSPAWKAGLQAGDVIVAVNTTSVKSTEQARDLLNSWPQKTLTLTIRRDGKSQLIELCGR